MDKLIATYIEELKKRMIANPHDYANTPDQAVLDDKLAEWLANKMLSIVKSGGMVSLNHNPALKAACKKHGITNFTTLAAYVRRPGNE